MSRRWMLRWKYIWTSLGDILPRCLGFFFRKCTRWLIYTNTRSAFKLNRGENCSLEIPGNPLKKSEFSYAWARNPFEKWEISYTIKHSSCKHRSPWLIRPAFLDLKCIRVFCCASFQSIVVFVSAVLCLFTVDHWVKSGPSLKLNDRKRCTPNATLAGGESCLDDRWLGLFARSPQTEVR